MAASACSMTFTTALEPGTQVRILLNAASATSPVSIDWGNGVELKYTVDPSMMAYNRWIDGVIEGETLKISGNVTEADLNELRLTSAEITDMTRLRELDLSKNELVTFQLSGVTPLETLNLNDNRLENNVYEHTTLSLENAGTTLTSLNVGRNTGLICLDIRDLEVLEYFYANDCPELGSVFICLPEDSRKALRTIDLSNCSLAHFYPVNLPNLHNLNLANNMLMTDADDEPFVLGSYPELTSIDVSNNSQIKALDLTGCKKLTSINISDNKFERIDVSNAPDLEVLYASGNNISSLDLGNNKKLRTLNISGNPVRELDVTLFPSMRNLNISNTKISRVMLMQASYLEEFRASGTDLEFVDFNGQQAGRMRIIDLRDNKCMTGATVDYTIHTLPEAKSAYNTDPTLLLSGSNAETANTAYATSIDMKWVCDITGNGTAKQDFVSVTLDGATDTGENRTGTVDRLYPIFGIGMDYDFDIYSTDGGKFLISQWEPSYFQSMMSVTDKARVGVPVHIYPYPEDGRKFKSVTVNGKEIFSQWFVIDGPSTIKVNFTSEESSISFTTEPGHALSFLVNTVNYNGSVWVDWGSGVGTEYPGQYSYTSGSAEIKGTRIDGSSSTGTVTIYGEIAGLDISGFGDMAEWLGLHDNAATSIDLSNAPDLKFLNLYWNPISELDFSGCPRLEVLDASFTLVKNLDLSGVPSLMWLDAYSDGYGDEEEGIAQLTSIDVTGLPILQYLNVKGNALTSLDLSQNTYLRWLNANNNKLTSLDLTENNIIEELNLDGNLISSLEISHLSDLWTLSISNNELTELDLSGSQALEKLYVANNRLTSLDCSPCALLNTIYLNGNGFTADQLNDIYYLLPQRKAIPDDDNTQNKIGYNLAVIQGGDKAANDGNRADSSIALDRGWTPSHVGSNGGSDFAYLDILPSNHGTVKVLGEDGTEYGHGSKVPKYSTLSIVPSPEAGYGLSSFTLNEEETMSSTSFEMPGIYTKLRVTFAKNSGAEADAADNVTVAGVKGGVYVNGSATVDIYAADGRHVVAAASVDGSEIFNLPAGIYIVRAASANGASVQKVAVN